MTTMKQIIEESNTKAGKVFDLTVHALIFISVITFSVSTLPNLSEQQHSFLHSIEIGIVALFTIEYLLRIIVSSHKLKFVCSFYGIIHLIAIFPFYIYSGLDLTAIRSLRLLRIVHVLKSPRYEAAVARFRQAFLLIREELILFLSAALLLLYLSGVGIYYFEHEAQPEVFASIFHSLWWAVATLTTVGYGDVYPITVGGKCFTTLILFIGLGIIAVPSGLISSGLSITRQAKMNKE